METDRRTDGGQVLILLALLLVMLLALAGLAIDVGLAYVVKTKLNAAVDAAALAAGKVVSAEDRTTDAEAQKFFYANYPDGLLGSTVQKPVTRADYDSRAKSWTVTVSSTASVPTYFAKVVGFSAFAVGATATSTINPVDLVLVMDCSSSLGPPTSPESTLGNLKEAAKEFVKIFNPRNDRVGLIHFASGAVQDLKITSANGFDRDRLNAAIDAIERGGYTTAEEALRMARKDLDDIPASVRSPLRIIVFFADGAPNGVAAKFQTNVGEMTGALSSQSPFLYAVDRRNSPLGLFSINTIPAIDWSSTVSTASYNGMRTVVATPSPGTEFSCNLNRAARNMVENVANSARSESGPSINPISVFTIGLGENMTKNEVTNCGYGNSEFGENIMKRLANVPGVDTYNPNQPNGVYAYAADGTQLSAAFNQVARAILRLSK